ncbi:MAG: hypothetical protein PHD31_01600 [Candidatus Pacebacteria bacterium]|nr:hypothetical protein [Candidatus Paceibacterota bacterium]
MLHIKFSPEALFMLPFAIGLDLVGIILICFGLDDFGITDILGIMFINVWLLMRGKKPVSSQRKKGVTNNLKKAFTHKWGKFALPTFTELIPYVGALPMWTLSVLSNLDEG